MRGNIQEISIFFKEVSVNKIICILVETEELITDFKDRRVANMSAV